MKVEPATRTFYMEPVRTDVWSTADVEVSSTVVCDGVEYKTVRLIPAGRVEPMSFTYVVGK